MEDVVKRFLEDMVGRLDGPMHLRLLLQPLMAAVFAARAGIRDARSKNPLYTRAMFARHAHRRALLREGWKDFGKVFVAALILDCVYQILTVRWIYPNEALLTAIILAFVPYLILRGPFTRLARLFGMGAMQQRPG